MNADPMETEGAAQTLCDAITARRVVAMTYAGRPVRMAPHAVFRSSGGQLLVTGTDFPPSSGAPARPGFRSYDLRNIQTVQATGEGFDVDAGFDPGAHRFRFGVVCSVADAR
ncbi:MAG: WYL domain-containing protein [Nitrospirota bacterium]|nr:WYL domain-containing protein [Nitrospirota bacterium]